VTTPQEANTLFSVKFTVTFGLVAAVFVVGTTIAYLFVPPPYQNSLIFFAAACAAAGHLGAALYAARILQFTIQSQTEATKTLAEKEERLERQALEDAAAKFGERWDNTSMFHLRKECQEIIDNKNNPQQIMTSIKGDKIKDVNVSNILNFLEELALSVNQKRCDETIAKLLFCGIVMNIWHATEPWVKSERTRLGRPPLWIELESLYQRWR
jgi:RNA binding exosome subunit